ncbi:hypothetical protein LCM19_12840 [Qipengyuania flava]|uniref:response regulator n=1 Tax=Qipengyuania aestuarii TaxID=2867241 RepID=UPI001C86A027|nr:hypothetical protein [Qipengyuania aestuarii]MBX7536238.1 hypothetical protein [Qipengyuania aestuarii]MCA0979255.1 hypothetical protein [Qipengyuania flava]
MNEHLAGKRVLIVDDSPMLAFEMVDLIEDMGGVPVGPEHSLSAALRTARIEALDGALLDIDLNGEQVWPLANQLMDHSVPVVFISAECTDRNFFPERFQSHLCIEKPAVSCDILDGLSKAMQSKAAPKARPVSSVSRDET